MTVSAEAMVKWCQALLGVDGNPDISLEDYVRDVPKLSSLADLPSGTPVLVRGDTDCKPGEKVGMGDVRLRSMKQTLQFGQQRGWKQIIFGHIGREPDKKLDKVAARLGEILGCEVPLISEWLDNKTNVIQPYVTQRIQAAAPGSVLMLQNTRAYDIERVLWKAKPADLVGLAPSLAQIANEFATKVATVFVNEAFSAGSLDASSTVVPAAMQRVALGDYVTDQLSEPMRQCERAQLVIFSGLKADKLDDMEAMIRRGHVRRMFCAGSLSMVLKKATAQLDGGDFCIGAAEDPNKSKEATYVTPARLEQAKRMIADGRKAGIEFVLPVDFMLADCSIVEKLTLEQAQFDIGPKSIKLFEQKIGEFIEQTKASGQPTVAFHNGVFGMFEDPRYETGTREFTKQLKRMTDAGLKVFVGGGEGGTALERYGAPNWITHCFTAGGTVLNALGSEPIPYLVALRMAAK